MYVNVNLRGKNSIEPYHIPCFEKLADFSHIEFLQRITLLTRRNWKTREVSVENFLKGAHVLDGGAERLVQHWVTVRVLLLGLRDQGEYIDAAQVPDPGSLYYSAGAPGYEHIAQPEKDMPEFLNFLVTLAPNESDGPDDREVWNLFDTYLTQQDVESFGNPHNLSEMLAKWDHDKRIANIPDEGATEEVKQEKARLGPKAIRALVRLSTVLVPHVQKTIMDQP
ncbi:hypothetical protein MMC25_000965 [Agyrium rufum]|nr:hypothetical protein [Agyrium rufum]